MSTTLLKNSYNDKKIGSTGKMREFFSNQGTVEEFLNFH